MSEGGKGVFHALSYPNYRLFFLGQSVSVAGTWMQTVAQQWLIWRLTHSEAWLGYMQGASALPFILFSLWGGQAADRYPRRLVLIWAQSAAMLLALLMTLLASNLLFPVQAWHIVGLAALSGVVNAYTMPAQQALPSELVDKEALGNAIALNSFRFNIARALGPMLAGFVLARSGEVTCFAINTISFLGIILSLWAMRLPPTVSRRAHVSQWGGFRYIWQDTDVFRVVTLVGFGAMMGWSASAIYPSFADRFGVGAAGFSKMVTANGVGAMLAGLGLAAYGHRFSRRATAYVGAILFSLSLLLFSLAPLYELALLCLVLSGFGMILFGISSNTSVQEHVPDELRGRVMAVYSLVFQGLFPVGGLEIGFLAERFGPAAAVRVNAFALIGITLMLAGWSFWERQRSP
jgi:MFS family permease